jgi:hypothetical protein
VFQCFRGTHCLHLQSDDLVQVDAEITGKKGFVGYVRKFE